MKIKYMIAIAVALMFIIIIGAKAQGYGVATVASDGVVTFHPTAVVQPLMEDAISVLTGISALYFLYLIVHSLFMLMSPNVVAPPDPTDADDIRNYDTSEWSQEARDKLGVIGDGKPYQH
jgi:hypothetical protein